MRVSELDYCLPPERIAQHPVKPRDAARLLVLRRTTGEIVHSRIRALPDLLDSGDLLVVNNTRVIPARVAGRKEDTGGEVEVFFVEPAARADEWHVLIRSGRRPRPGSRMRLEKGATAVMVEDGTEGRARIRIEGPASVLDWLQSAGRTPLPPYIRRKDPAGIGNEAEDRASYQTVYASRPGAVAAPTAGLHFTPALLEELRRRGIGRAEVTLHVGPGTFRPVKTDNLVDHAMDEERFELGEECARLVCETKAAGRRVVAVGSTSVRTLETATDGTGAVRPGAGRTGLFIRPPYAFRVVDAMLTNFHLPRSTLLAMVCAFAGREPVLRAYREAVETGYRFYSFGDAMLIL